MQSVGVFQGDHLSQVVLIVLADASSHQQGAQLAPVSVGLEHTYVGKYHIIIEDFSMIKHHCELWYLQHNFVGDTIVYL